MNEEIDFSNINVNQIFAYLVTNIKIKLTKYFIAFHYI